MKRIAFAVLLLAMLAGCGGEPEAEAPIRTEPPGLTVESGGGSIEADLSTYSWQNRGEDGGWEGGNADYPHPLDVLHQYPILETEAEEAVLVFEEEPDELSFFRFWREERFADTHSPEEEGILKDGTAVLEEGLCLYTVSAEWEREDWGGTVNYVFQIRRK